MDYVALVANLDLILNWMTLPLFLLLLLLIMMPLLLLHDNCPQILHDDCPQILRDQPLCKPQGIGVPQLCVHGLTPFSSPA